MDKKVNWPTSDPLFPKHPTDYNIAKFSLIPRLEEWPEIYSEQSLEEVALRAQLIGGIKLYDLVFIMAKSESHNEILPELWNYSGFNKGVGEFPKWKFSMAENEWSRAHVWYWSLWRWTIYEKFSGSDERKSYYFGEIAEKYPIPQLPLHKYATGEFEPVRDEEEQAAHHFIKLDEFAEYLEKTIEKGYLEGVSHMPLPKLLFPEKSRPQGRKDKTEKQRQSRYHEQRERARKIARPFLEERRKSISRVTKNHLRKKVLKPDRTPFTDNTYRKWIQDLRPAYCPKSTRHN